MPDIRHVVRHKSYDPNALKVIIDRCWSSPQHWLTLAGRISSVAVCYDRLWLYSTPQLPGPVDSVLAAPSLPAGRDGSPCSRREPQCAPTTLRHQRQPRSLTYTQVRGWRNESGEGFRPHRVTSLAQLTQVCLWREICKRPINSSFHNG